MIAREHSLLLMLTFQTWIAKVLSVEKSTYNEASISLPYPSSQNGKIVLPAYLGLFLDSIAPHFEELLHYALPIIANGDDGLRDKVRKR